MVSALLDTSKVIVGQSGLGKTVTAKDDVRQLLELRRHVAIVDPLGVWWGMRHNAAGDGPGFPLPIFGGEHGDLPIGPYDGAAIARVIIEQRRSAIVDLSTIHNSKDWRRFMADFVAELRKKPIGNFHFVVDEADEFAAERPADDIGFALRENMVWIAKRGRVRGFVPTYITQRTAEIAWAVISQVQTVIVHGLVAPSDQQPIEKYLKAHGSAEARKEVLGSLAELQIGERWIYSPRLKILERGFSPALTTFDSSRTPAAGEVLVEPRALAPIDVTAIRNALAAPAALPAGAIPADIAKTITERDGRIAALEQENAGLRIKAAEHEALLDGVAQLGVAIGTIFNGRPIDFNGRPIEISYPGDANLHREHASSGAAPDVESAAARVLPPVVAAEGAPPTDDIAGERSAGGVSNEREFRALAGLAAVYPAGLTEAAWAQRTGYSRKGGAWMRRRKRHLDDGLIEHRDGRWFATDAGVAAAGSEIPDMPPPGLALVKWWSTRLGAPGRILELLAAIAPRSLARDAIAAEVRMSPRGGAFNRYMTELKAAELITETRKRLAIAPGLMGEG